MFLIGLFQLAMSLLLISLIAFQRQPRKWIFILNTLAFCVAVLFLWVSGRWDIVTLYFRAAIPVLLLAAIFFGYRRIDQSKPAPGKLALGFLVLTNLFVLVLMGGMNWKTLEGYVQPEGAINLESPLRDGHFVVLHGGFSPFINGHYHVRPQNHALDILGLNSWGMRAKAFGDGNDLEVYVIYGATLYSPCDGTVVVAVDGFKDQIPPQTDTENLAGNHVMIECEGIEVILAHMKNGSVRVSAGDQVTTETILGQVGNTGNTSEPHLHIHAETGGEPGVILDGRAVPITIDGRYLVRGNVLKNK